MGVVAFAAVALLPPPDLGRLARDQFAAGRFREALALYTRWEPRSWCGTCEESQATERVERIARCHALLGEHPAAAAVLLSAGRSGALSAEAGVFLYGLYRDAGQLADLWRWADAADAALLAAVNPKWPVGPGQREQLLREYAPTWPVREAARRPAAGPPQTSPPPVAGSLPRWPG